MAGSNGGNKKNGGSSEADAFWELDFMLPPKKTTAFFSRDTSAVEVKITAPAEKTEAAPIPKKGAPKPDKLDGKSYSAEPVCSYKPKNPLINKISVWRWPSKYTFYERFRSDAIKYYPLTGSECPFVNFYSYMPQYMQLNPEQRAYYLWWRENARRGVWLETDYSYIFLYIYEIINLPDFISPSKAIAALCGLWLAYRDKFTKLDRYLAEWVCDFCLINVMEPPTALIAPIIGAVLDCATLKEFYFTPGSGDGPASSYAAALLNYATNYNWRSGKFYNADTAAFFEEHIAGAFTTAVEILAKTDPRFAPGDKNLVPVRITRDAYAGSLCAYNIKRRIDIEYYACTRSPELRMLVTDLIKFAENQARAMLGIKNRFSTASLTEEMKAAALEYFKPLRAKKKSKEEQIPEYMRHYEPETAPLSPESALKIEERSWDTTNLLLDAFSAPEENAKDASPDAFAEVDTGEDEAGVDLPSPAAVSESGEAERGSGPDAFILDGLRAAKESGSAFAKWAKGNNLLPDAAAEMINEALYDTIGDAVLEESPSGAGYTVIEDYISEVERLIVSS